MTYIKILITRNGAVVAGKLNFKSTEKANAFFRTLMREDSTMTTYSDTHKKITHTTGIGEGASMYLETISFQDEK